MGTRTNGTPGKRSRRGRASAAVSRDEGQALVLLALLLVGIIGLVGLSVDVGRVVWARTQMQAAVDAAALAAAQSLPSTTAAEATANEYFEDNAGIFYEQGSNVQLTVTTDGQAKRVLLKGEADLDTWFMRVLGIPSFHIKAEAEAESLVVDAVLVLDRSGSMCWDSHGPSGNYYGRVRLANSLAASSTDRTVTLTKDSAYAAYALADILWVGQRFKFSGKNEWMEIAAIGPAAANGTIPALAASQVYVTRNVANPNVNGGGSAAGLASHSAGARLHGNTCQQAGKGPYYPWVHMKNGANVFVDQLNPVYDRIGYVHYGTRGTVQSAWTQNFASLKSTISNSPDPSKPAGSPANGDNTDYWTNIAHGIWTGRTQLLTARSNAKKVMVLLSDGVASAYCGTYNASCSSYSTGQSGAAAATARSHALAQASQAAAEDIVIYTIAYGADSDPALMQEIAELTGGTYHWAPDDQALQEAFEEIGKATNLRLSR